jgi:Undecaprenyl-phosphate glucose phosphotransferase
MDRRRAPPGMFQNMSENRWTPHTVRHHTEYESAQTLPSTAPNFSAMNSPNLTAGPAPASPARRLPGRDAATLWSDLLPLCDLLALLVTLSLGVFMQSRGWLFRATHDNPLALAQAGFSAALLAPFILYDKNFGEISGQHLRNSRISTFLTRFAIFMAIVLVLSQFHRSFAPFSTGVVVAGLAVAFVVTAAVRLAFARLVLRLHRQGHLTQQVAVFGAGPAGDRLVQVLQRHHPEAITVLGVFDDRMRRPQDAAMPPLGDLERLIELARVQPLDWIVLTLPASAETRLAEITQRLAVLQVPIALCPGDLDLDLPVGASARLGGNVAVSMLADRPLGRRDALVKGGVDLVVGGLMTLLLLPVLLLIAVVVKLDSPGPAIFRQRRHAVNGQEFDIFKFRTMRWAEATPGAPLQQTSRQDRRVTAVGRFLRASSLDELPQLFNVMRGEMSLVGPRPHAVNMRTEDRLGHEITQSYAQRNRVKPGITGWAQINGARGATDTTSQLKRRVELDLHYIDNWSLLLDLRILARTVKEVVRSSDAY